MATMQNMLTQSREHGTRLRFRFRYLARRSYPDIILCISLVYYLSSGLAFCAIEHIEVFP